MKNIHHKTYEGRHKNVLSQYDRSTSGSLHGKYFFFSFIKCAYQNGIFFAIYKRN